MAMRSINHVNPYFRVGCRVTLPAKYQFGRTGLVTTGVITAVHKATIRRKGMPAQRAYVVIRADVAGPVRLVRVPQGDWRWLHVIKLSPYGFYDY
jgi:hypothetical protein